MLLFDTYLYFNMKLIVRNFPSYFSPMLQFLHLLKNKVYRYFKSQSNTRIDCISSHLYTSVMICKLKKLILEVSLDLKIYFIYSVYSYCMKKSSILIHVVFFAQKIQNSIQWTHGYRGHFFEEPQVSAIDRFNCSGKVKWQILGPATGTKCAATYTELISLWYGLGMLITFSLHGDMERKNLKKLWRT